MKTYTPDYSIDLSKTILWQYDKAENLKTLINNKQEFVNQAVTEFFQDWYRDVFNLETANYFGLIVWALILGVPEYVNMTYSYGKNTFGFGRAHRNFYESNFSVSSSAITLTTEQLRAVLKAQMLLLNSNGSVYDANKMLKHIFPDRNVYVQNSNDMSRIFYVFADGLSDDESIIVLFSNILTAPLGVARGIKDLTKEEVEDVLL